MARLASVPHCAILLLLFPFVGASDPAITLRQAGDRAGVLVGAAVRPSLFSEAAYSETLGREFNMVEPEDAMKWWVVRRNQGVFDFEQGDAVVRFALAHGMKIRGHCLVWDHNNPEWLTPGHFTPSQLSQLLHERISTEMKHYAGQVFAWDVVKEAIDERGQFKDSPWYTSRGSDFRGKAQPTLTFPCQSMPPAMLRRKICSARRTFLRAWCGPVCQIRAVPRFRPGDSPTSIPGSARIRTGHSGRLPFDRSYEIKPAYQAVVSH